MARDERKRQKKLAKQKSKQLREKRAAAAEKQFLNSRAGQMVFASNGKILECAIGDSADCERSGIITIFFARRAPDGRVAFANFMVDLWCMGVKDCVGKLLEPAHYREIVVDFEEKLNFRTIAPEQALAIILAGVDYAHSLGISPHSDFEKIAPIWSGINAGRLPREFCLGLNGRPCYVAGPFDDEAKQNRILGALFQSVGEGNFDFISPGMQRLDTIWHDRFLPEVELLTE